MGKFDSMRDGEGERKQKGKRNRFLPSTGAEGIEKERALKAIHHVLSKDGKSQKVKDANSDEEQEPRKKKKVIHIIGKVRSLYSLRFVARQ